MSTAKYIAYTVAIVAAGAVVYQVIKSGKKVTQAIGDTVSTVVDAVNPASKNNLAYRAATWVGDTAAGAGPGQSVPAGARLWEWMNPAARAAEVKMLSSGAPDKSGRFLGGDSDEFGNAIERTAPVPSGPSYEWGPSIMGELSAP